MTNRAEAPAKDPLVSRAAGRPSHPRVAALLIAAAPAVAAVALIAAPLATRPPTAPHPRTKLIADECVAEVRSGALNTMKWPQCAGD